MTRSDDIKVTATGNYNTTSAGLQRADRTATLKARLPEVSFGCVPQL